MVVLQALGADPIESDNNKAQSVEQTDIDRLAINFIEAINNDDELKFAKLFCSKAAYIANRVPKDDLAKSSELALEASYKIAKVNFISDLEAFKKKGNGFSQPLNLRYISSRVIERNGDSNIQSIEILVEYGNTFGTGRAYIVTGELVKGEDSWMYLGRCKEIYSRYPVKHNK